jgi:DNA-binding transcriptional MerR regulator
MPRAAKDRGAKKVLKMKDLERASGVGRESIRFYIRAGLLPEPDRRARNVAYYDESFVERIRLIKELQQKRFLPLQVIKAILAGDVAPSSREVEALTALDGKLFRHLQDSESSNAERLAAVAARLRVSARELRELAETGMLAIVTRDGDQWLEGTSLRLAELWARLRAAGFTPELGFKPEQARLYVDMISWLAREELRLFTRQIAARIPSEQAAQMAEVGIETINQILALLRRETLLRYVAEGNLPQDEAGKPGGRSGTDPS